MSSPIKRRALLVTAIILIVAIVLGAIAWLGAYYFYRPSYLKSDKTFDITPIPYEEEITVMSYNLRFVSGKDCGKRSWFYRADLALEVISQAKPDVIGFQEVTETHEKYITEHLKGYNFHIEYRQKGSRRESTAIAYRSDRFSLKSEGHFWLSSTPEKMSKYSYSGNYRDANYVVLADGKTGKEFAFYNTHLDSRSAKARLNGMIVILEQMKKTSSLPTVLTGDMNDFADSPMYKKAIDGGLKDSLSLAKERYEGSGITYNGYGKSTDPRIDFCFVSDGISVNSYRVSDALIDGDYASDHFPVITKITLE